MLKKIAVMTLVVLMLSVPFTIAIPRAKASGSSMKLYVDPPMIVNQALVSPMTFNISIKADNIPADPGLAGMEFTLTWNSSLLNGVAMQEVLFHEVTPPANWSNIWRTHKRCRARLCVLCLLVPKHRPSNGGRILPDFGQPHDSYYHS